MSRSCRAYCDNIGKVVKGDPSTIMPFIHETQDVGVTGMGRTTAQYFEYIDEEKRGNDPVNSEEIDYDLLGRTYLELEAATLSVQAESASNYIRSDNSIHTKTYRGSWVSYWS